MELTGPPVMEPVDANVYVGTDQGVVGPPTGAVVTRMAAMARLVGRCTFEDLPLYWQAIVGAQSPTGAGPYSRAYNLPRGSLPPLYPYTVQAGFDGNAYRLPGALLTQHQQAGDWDGDGIWTFQSEFRCQKKEPLTSTNEVQTLTIGGTATGGTFILSYQGVSTSPLAYNSAAAAIQTALLGLATIGAGNVVCGGGPLPGTPVTVTFQGALANSNADMIQADGTALTGTSPTISVAETTRGGGLTPLAERVVEKISMAATNLWLDPYGTVPGTTALTAVLVSFQLTLNTGRMPLGAGGSPFAQRAASGRYTAVLRLRLVNSAAVKALVDTLLNGSPSNQVIRIQGTGSGGRVATIDYVGTLHPPSDLTDRNGASAQDLEFEAVYDPTNALFTKQTVVNNLSTLAA